MSNSIKCISVYCCGEIAERNGWMFREQPTDDIGIDAYMVMADSSGKPKQLLVLQIKSRISWFSKQKYN